MAKGNLKKIIQEAQETENPKSVEEELDPKLSLHKKTIDQIQAEYRLCWLFMHPKINEWLLRLRIYNNQKRSKDDVGDNLMFTIHQTVLANLYDDEFNALFGGREEGDEIKAENLNMLARYDAQNEMNKDMIDYEWDWDSTFFGRGYTLLNDFDRDSKTPLPEVIDPTTLVRDPRCVALNGDAFGRSAARFFGREIRMAMYEMKENGSYFNLNLLRKETTNLQSLVGEAREARRDAQGFDNFLSKENSLTENYEYSILQWFTHIGGEKYVIELANSQNLIVRIAKLPWKKWPIIERSIFPISHDFDGVSIPDLTEDKQRMRAVLINLGVDTAKADLYGMYLFDQNKIKNRNDLNFDFNKWIPVDGPVGDAVQVMEKKQISRSVDFILNLLEAGAEKASATPASQQGQISKESRTLGEIELVASRSGVRYSLPAKIFGWSEKRFWEQWYRVYDKNFHDGIDRKSIRLVGSFGPKWVEFSKEDIKTENKLGPDIEIESRVVSEAKRLRRYQILSQYMGFALQDQFSSARYARKKMGQLAGLKKDEIDRLLPATVDEMDAERENEFLSENKPMPVRLEENHVEHLEMHKNAKDTKALINHVEAHKEAMRRSRVRPELYPGLARLQPPETKINAPNERVSERPAIQNAA